MLTQTALDHFNGSRMAIARALGLTKSAVYQWRRVVPKASAADLERYTGGKIKIDDSCYDGHRPIDNHQPSDTAAA